MSSSITELVKALNELLKIDFFHDYAPNGLQVAGKKMVTRIMTGVTANEALIDAAIAEKADVLLVHHGYFWKGESAVITGIKRNRLAKLLAHNINLLAYHLPLDAHPTLGNNQALADLLEFQVTGALRPKDSQAIGLIGVLNQPMFLSTLQEYIHLKLNQNPLTIQGHDRIVKTIGWCTGAAQDYIDDAVHQGVDAYLSGEISERTVHTAREANIHYIAAGHHATERYGIQRLGEWLEKKFHLEHRFVDISNPA
ncbi:MAG: Nif3-like dinuclear metal center hexameric protein [Endozoicomonadaceae bacterium]|nr:Nif3-like dinuclear metal center hexameric protein [Endozoicomonadaceae bacterium]MBE8232571.1 Nif3-like dinuclear metal center hexameric protein [Endozoicomonadaceae bacterium]